MTKILNPYLKMVLDYDPIVMAYAEYISMIHSAPNWDGSTRHAPSCEIPQESCHYVGEIKLKPLPKSIEKELATEVSIEKVEVCAKGNMLSPWVKAKAIRTPVAGGKAGRIVYDGVVLEEIKPVFSKVK